MMTKRATRRRFIQISALFGGIAALGGLGSLQTRAASSLEQASHDELSTHTWKGIALGADATLQITHPDAVAAQALIDLCIAEVRRLEGLFSLYRPDSALSMLNQHGTLTAPASDFLALLTRSLEFSRMTDGMFDVTIQPLWLAYANHFKSGNVQTPDLSPAIRDALELVDWRQLHLDAQSVRLMQPGMAITLNGIAQGYITDRITQLLRAHGIEHALVNMGEIYGMNPDLSENPWQVGLQNARHPDQIITRVPVHNQAVATSGGHGTRFTPDMHHHHLLNPFSGASSHRYRAVSVVASDATTADALSTAFSLMPETSIRTVSQELGVQTYIQPNSENGIYLI